MVKSVPLIGKQRKPFKALRGVSFEIQTGMFGLLGPNGAGKSTLMRVICGIFEQSYGSIWINGMDTRIYREELQSLIGFLPQEFGTYENMTSWEFLDYQAILKGIIDEDLRKERLEYPLMQTLELDSLDLVDMVVLIEKNFGFNVTGQDFVGIKTFQDFYNLVITRMAENKNE